MLVTTLSACVKSGFDVQVSLTTLFGGLETKSTWSSTCTRTAGLHLLAFGRNMSLFEALFSGLKASLQIFTC